MSASLIIVSCEEDMYLFGDIAKDTGEFCVCLSVQYLTAYVL